MNLVDFSFLSRVALLFCLLASAPVCTYANPLATRYSQPATGSAVTVIQQDAAPNFPDTVDFTLKTSGFLAARATLNYSLVGEAVTAGEEADVPQPSDTLDLKLTLDLATNYIPPGTQVSYYWTLTAPSSDTVDTPAKTFDLLDAGYNWQ